MHCYTIKRDARRRPVSIDLPVSRKEKYGLSFKNHLVLHAHGRHEPCTIVRQEFGNLHRSNEHISRTHRRFESHRLLQINGSRPRKDESEDRANEREREESMGDYALESRLARIRRIEVHRVFVSGQERKDEDVKLCDSSLDTRPVSDRIRLHTGAPLFCYPHLRTPREERAEPEP